MPLPSKADLERLGENLAAIEDILSGIDIDNVTTPAGVVHKSISSRLRTFQEMLDARDSEGRAALADAVSLLGRYSAINYKGAHVADTAYKANDVWTDPADNSMWIVPADYTAGATALADITDKKVRPHQDVSNKKVCTSLAQLKNVIPQYPGQVFFLSAGGRSGNFVVVYGDFSAQVAGDTEEGVYVAMDGVPPSVAVLFRSSSGGVLNSEWFGVSRSSTPAQNADGINSAIYVQSRFFGGGIVVVESGTIEFSSTLIPRRNVIIKGRGDTATILKLADGSNCDPVKSENFDSLTLTGETAVNPLCPYNFGFENIMIDGNGENQTSGEGVKLYGPRLKLKVFFVYRCRGNNLYTEYSPNFGSTSPESQEEGEIDQVISRNSVTGSGWVYRGPHNTIIGSVICSYNYKWGFRNEYFEEVYDGNISELTHLHTYANGLDGSNSESYFGAVTNINTLIVDGGHSEVASSDCQINKIKLIFGGQSNHGVIISGDHNNISTMSGAMLTGTSGYDVLRITGNNNYVGRAILNGSYNSHDGLFISGTGNTVEDLNSRECLRGCTITGGLNTVNGKLLLCTDSFSYSTPSGTHPGRNRVSLEIYQTSGNYVIGDRPVDQLDQFNIQASGKGNLRCSSEVQSDLISLDITTNQNITIPHGLLYTPTKKSVSVTLLSSEPADNLNQPHQLYVLSTDSTNVVVSFRMGSAAPEGSKGRIGVKVKI